MVSGLANQKKYYTNIKSRDTFESTFSRRLTGILHKIAKGTLSEGTGSKARNFITVLSSAVADIVATGEEK
jgi:hypothetical protein